MPVQIPSDPVKQLRLLEALAEEPDVRQIDLAARVGVAVGTVNWLLKRMVTKGYVKVKRLGQWRWRYLLTPQGFAEKARLTEQYLHDSLNLYRRIRQEARELLVQVRERGFDRICLHDGTEDDLEDVFRLTCLEQGIAIAAGRADGVPVVHAIGNRLHVEWPQEAAEKRVVSTDRQEGV